MGAGALPIAAARDNQLGSIFCCCWVTLLDQGKAEKEVTPET